MIHGKDLILSDSQTGSGHFACATSCTVSTKSDFIEVAHPTEGGWKRYKPTILSWSASTGHLLASYSNYKYFRNMQESKQAVTIRFYDAELQIFYKGEAFIETLELTGDVRGFAKMKVSLQPSGPLTQGSCRPVVEMITSLPASSRVLCWRRMEGVGLMPSSATTGSPVEIPPRIPPAWFVRKPPEVISSLFSLPRMPQTAKPSPIETAFTAFSLSLTT